MWYDQILSFLDLQEQQGDTPAPPPGWGLTFSSYPWKLVKIAFTPEDLKNMSPTPEEFREKLHPQRISYQFLFYL